MTLKMRMRNQRRRLSELLMQIFSLKTRGSKNHQMGDQRGQFRVESRLGQCLRENDLFIVTID